MIMNMKKVCLLVLFTFSCIVLVAQNSADAYLDKVVAQFRNAPGVSASFTLKGDTQSGIYMQGALKMKGEKFSLETNDMTTWYDGKTMWSYAASMQEVNITEPTRQELVEINPYMLLDSYKQSFTAVELKSTHKGERSFALTPTKRNTSVKQIILTVATATMLPISFEIIGNNNNRMLVAITNYNDKNVIPDTAFTFDAAKYKGVTIVDLR